MDLDALKNAYGSTLFVLFVIIMVAWLTMDFLRGSLET